MPNEHMPVSDYAHFVWWCSVPARRQIIADNSSLVRGLELGAILVLGVLRATRLGHIVRSDFEARLRVAVLLYLFVQAARNSSTVGIGLPSRNGYGFGKVGCLARFVAALTNLGYCLG